MDVGDGYPTDDEEDSFREGRTGGEKKFTKMKFNEKHPRTMKLSESVRRMEEVDDPIEEDDEDFQNEQALDDDD